MSVEDPGRPHDRGVLNATRIRWAADIPAEWWRNSHRLARHPAAFTETAGRFSAPGLPRKVLYLGGDPVACFWESGLGRDLNSRLPDDLNITQTALEDRWEYVARINPRGLKIFHAADAAARRSVGARTSACFSADHAVARRWAEALMKSGADGILYDSTRQSPGVCLAVFDTPAALRSLGAFRKVGSSYENPAVMAHLTAENVAIVGV